MITLFIPGLAASFFATLCLFLAIWRASVKQADCGIVDIFWGLGFVGIAWIQWTLSSGAGPAGLALAAMVTLWGFRLSWHLRRRHKRAFAEDARYAAMRQRYGLDWPQLSLYRLFLVQAVVLFVVASPIHAGLLAPSPAPWNTVATIGALIFAAGFVLETAADALLDRFSRHPANHGKLLTTGLFAWSRHPNYFGESVLWWGLALVAYAISGNVLAFIGPALLTALLLKVSGVPPLEEHLRTRPGFGDYVRRTSVFVPRPPRDIAPLYACKQPAPGETSPGVSQAADPSQTIANMVRPEAFQTHE